MNVVDSSGWIEYFTERENASFFLAPIRDLERLIVPTICIYEVFKCLLAERDEDRFACRGTHVSWARS